MKFRFEITASCIIELEDSNIENARMHLVECDDLYYEDLLNNVTISNGMRIKE